MPEKTGKNDKNMVRKETVILIAVVFLGMGFVAGTVFGVLKARSLPTNHGGQGVMEDDRHGELEKAVENDPENPEVWAVLGNHYFDTGQSEKAIAAYEKSLELKPDNPHVMVDSGVMYRRVGKPEEAIRRFEKASALDPGNEPALFNKGIVLYYDLSRKKEALEVWEKLLKINPAAVAPDGRPLETIIEELSE